MPITNNEIKNIAELSRLSLSPEEEVKLGGQLNSILEYIGRLRKLDTSQVAATVSASGLVDVWRSDDVREWPREEVAAALSQGATEGGRVKVKRVL